MEPLGVLRCAKHEIGLYIASHYNQINVKYNPKDRLVSEDLKKENIKVLKYLKEYSYKENKK